MAATAPMLKPPSARQNKKAVISQIGRDDSAMPTWGAYVLKFTAA